MKNTFTDLSDIYSNNILLNEGKDNVASNKKNLHILPNSEVEIEPLAKGRGTERVKIKKPVENTKLSTVKRKGTKNTKVQENMNTSNKYEGAFEKLFKSTLTEDFAEDSAVEGTEHADEELPVTDEDMADEIGGNKDEVTDLVSDLKSVIEHLQSILDKLHESGESEAEETEEHEAGGEEEGEEEPFEESLATDEAEEEGHALVDTAKLSKGLVGPKGKFNVGGVKTTTGKAINGTIKIKPDTTELPPTDKGLQNTKKFNPKSSSIKVGDFFK